MVRHVGGATSDFVVREKLAIGRNPNRNNVCLADREVSKEHATVERRGAEVLLKDLGSSNGTFVNGRQVTEAVLRDGDLVRMGNTEIIFVAGEPTTQGGFAPTANPAQQTQPEGTPHFPPSAPRLAPIPLVPQPAGAARAPAPIPLQLHSAPTHQPGAAPAPAPRTNFTVVHSMNAPVLAQVKQNASERVPRAADQIETHDELKAEYERLLVALDFRDKIRIDQGPDALLERILEFAHERLKADNGAIVRKTDEGNYEPLCIKQRKAGNASFSVSDTLLEQVITSRSAVLIQDVEFDPRFNAAQSIVSQGIKCAMGVPLIVSGHVREVLYLDTLNRTHAFRDRDLKMLSGIANQAAIALENVDLIEKNKNEERTRDRLSRFLSPALIEQAQNGQIDLTKGGSLTEITILFSDIRGFTSLSEKESAQDVMKMLNDYFEQMVEAVFDTGGMLDKFIGDAVMALWGAPLKRPDDPDRAVMTALEMQRRVVQFNQQRRREGKPPVYVGIGINTGQAVVGNMGSSKRMEYTAIGDAVNLASRLCHEAKANEIIISSSTMERLPANKYDLDTSLPPASVKGKAKPIAIAKVLDFATEPTSAALKVRSPAR